MKRIYELLPHTADIKMRISADTQPVLFERALASMFSFMQPNTEQCVLQPDGIYHCARMPVVRQVNIESPEVALLLVDFLSHALALSEIYREAYFVLACERCDATCVIGSVRGVPVDGFDGVGIKAVTHHELQVYQDALGWHADIIFDI